MTVTITDKDIEKAVNLYVEELLSGISQTADDHVFSERYERRKAQIIAYGAKPAGRRGGRRTRRVPRIIAAALLVVVLSFCLVMAFSPSARAGTLEAAMEVYNRIMSNFNKYIQEEQARTLCAPGSLPDGFVNAERVWEDGYTLQMYRDPETGSFLRFEYSKATESLIAEVERQKAMAALLTSGATEKYCIERRGHIRVFWYDRQHQLVFFIDSDLDKEVLTDCLKTIFVRPPLIGP